MGDSRATLTEIEQFWSSAAQAPLDRDRLRPVARDEHLQDLVERAIESRLPKDATLFDFGSGDGLSM